MPSGSSIHEIPLRDYRSFSDCFSGLCKYTIVIIWEKCLVFKPFQLPSAYALKGKLSVYCFCEIRASHAGRAASGLRFQLLMSLVSSSVFDFNSS